MICTKIHAIQLLTMAFCVLLNLLYPPRPRDAFIVTTLDTFTSLLAGTTIFAILGNLAYNLKADSIRDVIRSGAGVAFISYPGEVVD